MLYMGSLLCETASLFEANSSLTIEYQSEKEKDTKESKEKEAKEKIIPQFCNKMKENNGINTILKNRFMASARFISSDYSLDIFMPPEHV